MKYRLLISVIVCCAVGCQKSQTTTGSKNDIEFILTVRTESKEPYLASVFGYKCDGVLNRFIIFYPSEYTLESHFSDCSVTCNINSHDFRMNRQQPVLFVHRDKATFLNLEGFIQGWKDLEQESLLASLKSSFEEIKLAGQRN